MSTIKVEKSSSHASRFKEESLKKHRFYRGKIEMVAKCKVAGIDDFSLWYTPGVAEPCKAIQRNTDLVYDYTNRWNTVAVVSDGSRVLGLGDIGPEAALPVMEGKALIFKYLGGVDAIPICVDASEPEELINLVKRLQPSFGGINLEDIAQPKCFSILARLRKECDIPVWHDDQQGTATVTLAGVINALKVVHKNLPEVKIVLLGAGAANLCIARLLIFAGADPKKMIILDTKGALHAGRKELKKTHPDKWELCLKTNPQKRTGDLPRVLPEADVLIALSQTGPDVIKKEWIKTMAEDSIVFACANPVPEIWPWKAKEAGAKVVATGRSDFPNQVNNSLGFPGIFRGALDVRAKTISNEMCLAAANELADYACKKGLKRERILPTMDDWEVYSNVAVAVAKMAMSQGLARLKVRPAALKEKADYLIQRAQKMTQMLMKEEFIRKE
ncbi:MAG: NADP-dependent malic enzyme [Elusimicrobiota bacterium]